MVRNLGLKGCSECTGDDLAKGDEEGIGTNASASHGSWSQLSDVKGPNDSSSTDTNAEHETTNNHLSDRVRSCDDNGSDGEAIDDWSALLTASVST